MVFSRFNRIILIHAVCMALVTAGIIWTLSREYMIIVTITLSFILLGILMHLIWYVQKTNRELTFFLEAFRQNDSSVRFRAYRDDPSFRNLHMEFNTILQQFSLARSETEIRNIFLHNTIKHVKVGILAFNEEGDIELINDTVKNLFPIKGMKNVQELNEIKSGLARVLLDMTPGNMELVKLNLDKDIYQLSLNATTFIIKGKKIKLVSIKDVKAELEAGELEAWQKLIKVMRHEILNSLGSIKIVSSSMINMIEDNKNHEQDQRHQENAVTQSLDGLHAINSRVDGLIRFIEYYRNLSDIREPSFQWVNIRDIMKHIRDIFEPEMKKFSIQFNSTVMPPELQLYADRKLIEQVLINLIRNSMNAFREDAVPEIRVSWYQMNENIYCEVTDNGRGIEKKEIENIFVPFYTTREEGTGLGLSISRQIMRLHKGTINVQSVPAIETKFTMQF